MSYLKFGTASKKVYRILISFAFVLLFFILPINSLKTNAEESNKYGIYIENEQDGVVERYSFLTNSSEYEGVFTLKYDSSISSEDFPLEVKIETSDSSVVELYKDTILLKEDEDSASIYGLLKKAGVVKIKVTAGDYEKEFVVVIHGTFCRILVGEQATWKHIKLNWTKTEGADGYVILRLENSYDDEGEEIAYVEQSDNPTAYVEAPKDKNCYYYIANYVKYNNKVYYYKYLMGYNPKRIALTDWAPPIQSVKEEDTNHLKVTWDDEEDATQYRVYVSEHENGSYKRIATTTKNSYSYKVTPGKIYYFRVQAKYPNGWGRKSNAVSGLTLISGRKYSVVEEKNISQNYQVNPYGLSNLWDSGNYSSVDDTYYYMQGSTLYTVCYQYGKSLHVYKMSSKGATLYKTIKLGTHDYFGGFYHGDDGNFYVAVGFHNPKESKTKTVIKVIKYSSKWEKVKTCNIKANACNYYMGIVTPFAFSNASMTMQGDTLYLATARTMYKMSDGLNHQSNIGFKINTKDMTYIDDCTGYVSHSFCQIAKYKDGNLYQLDHGDEWPRALALSIEYNSDTEIETTEESGFFCFIRTDRFGDNYTGTTVGGMEIGKNNIMVCGTSVPHEESVKGVEGLNRNYQKNVYLITLNRKTGIKKHKWLTKNNPETSKIEVSETRMVKLTENRFVILYSTTVNKQDTLYYVVVNNDGKVLLTKKYKGLFFCTSSQPFVAGGYIHFVTNVTASSGKQDDVSKHVRIPVVY